MTNSRNTVAKRRATKKNGKQTKRAQRKARPDAKRQRDTPRPRNGRAMTVVSGTRGRIVNPVGQRTGIHMSHFNASPHPDLNGAAGHQVSLSMSPCDLYRGTSGFNKCFMPADGYAYGALTPNPIYITGTDFERMSGQGTPAQILMKLYVRYALRRLVIHYIPTNGLMETGTCILLWQPVGPTELPITTFTSFRSEQTAMSFALNKPQSFTIINENTSQAAKRLYYIDPTNVTKENLAPGFLMACMDSADATGRSMGQLWFEMTFDLYLLQGNPNPTSMEDVVRKEKLQRQRRLQQDLDELKMAPVEVVRSYASQSTSSATSSVAPSFERKEDSKEKKDVREDFYVVPRRQ